VYFVPVTLLLFSAFIVETLSRFRARRFREGGYGTSATGNALRGWKLVKRVAELAS
jgi:hypothetical protein